MKNPTKYYSCKQESSIADYLGWKVVPGSGARDFNPGDIISESHLGECKTHVSQTDKIKFFSSVWNKIQKEAESKMRCPVLFVDNGTQKIENTWCMLPKRYTHLLVMECVHEPECSLNRTGVVFQHSYLKSVLHYSYIVVLDNFPNVKYPLVIMSLPTFKGILDGEL